MSAQRYRAYGADGSVIAQGNLTKGEATFDSGDAKVANVVFYGGSKAEEHVVGDSRIGRSGEITVSFVDEG